MDGWKIWNRKEKDGEEIKKEWEKKKISMEEKVIGEELRGEKSGEIEIMELIEGMDIEKKIEKGNWVGIIVEDIIEKIEIKKRSSEIKIEKKIVKEVEMDWIGIERERKIVDENMSKEGIGIDGSLSIGVKKLEFGIECGEKISVRSIEEGIGEGGKKKIGIIIGIEGIIMREENEDEIRIEEKEIEKEKKVEVNKVDSKKEEIDGGILREEEKEERIEIMKIESYRKNEIRLDIVGLIEGNGEEELNEKKKIIGILNIVGIILMKGIKESNKGKELRVNERGEKKDERKIIGFNKRIEWNIGGKEIIGMVGKEIIESEKGIGI